MIYNELELKVINAIKKEGISEVEEYFADYLREIQITPSKKDKIRHSKLCSMYANYQVRKAKEEIKK